MRDKMSPLAPPPAMGDESPQGGADAGRLSALMELRSRYKQTNGSENPPVLPDVAYSIQTWSVMSD